ncbi:MAG TPA: glycosyl hydrolase 115 family protein [Rhizomicrobium sp.]|nr:glycosyl hydrolase 115 family protein [Rhizomicrobium sp.]
MGFSRGLVAAALALLAAAIPAGAAPLSLYKVTIVTDGDKTVPLGKAAALLARDLTALTGHAPAVATGPNGLDGTGIIIGTLDQPLIAALLKANRVDPAPIAGKWETYGRVAIPAPWNPKARALLIFGSDLRGAIYGVTDLSRALGVSPWEWWADVAIRHVDRLETDGALRFSHEPSVKYRAIFLNDEDFGLKPWAAKTYEPDAGTIGPKTYARIFELMWRLKADTIWPAMHKGTVAFDEEPGNAEMADAYAIIHATSHAEPMLRNNDREWDAAKRGPFNWLTNRAQLLDYWDSAVASHSRFENIYTLGLRGVGDYPMQGADGPAAMRDILADVITQQRAILEHRLGRPANTIPQVFTPYKEVLPAYDTGLKVPDDVTLTWPDDNFGYIRRLSNTEERARSGGAGVYYHISYWGAPTSYLWLATQHPALLWEEMRKAYQFDARRIWILNVGDIKPGEYLTQLFLDMAWDDDRFADVASVRAHLHAFAAETFGAAHADEITDILWRTYDLAFSRKPEFMGFNTQYPVTTAPHQTGYDMLDFGDENARRMDAYRDLALRAARLAKALPRDRRDAFFELVDYPVGAASAIDMRTLALDKAIAYGLQRRASANLYAGLARAAHRDLVDGETVYNTTLAGGKWRGMMDIAPAKLPQYTEPAYPTWSDPGDKTCALQAEGGGYYDVGGAMPALPAFQRELPRALYVDLFLKSPAAVHWTATPSAPWIVIDKTQGTFDPKFPEQRLHVDIDWKAAPDKAQGGITLTCDGTPEKFIVAVHLAPRNTAPSVSFIESDRIVSIFATHPDATAGAWDVLTGLGHTGASLRSDLKSTGHPTATYRFATTTADDRATLRLIALPTLPVTSKDGVRVAVSIDGTAPVTLDLKTAEFSAAWRQNVLTNSAIGTVNNLDLKPGAHTLSVTALDPGVILDRYEIAFDGAPRAYDPVPETRIVK